MHRSAARPGLRRDRSHPASVASRGIPPRDKLPHDGSVIGGSDMRRVTRQLVSLSVVLTVAMVGMGTAQALISTTQPQLTLNHFIRTSPFTGSSTEVRDNEGSAYVAGDDALWMADDNDDALFEVDRTTGALRRKVAQSAFINAPRSASAAPPASRAPRTSRRSPTTRTPMSSTPSRGARARPPTVFRLTRGRQRPVPGRVLASAAVGVRPARGGARPTASPTSRNGSTIRTYDFATNTFGPSFSISGLSKHPRRRLRRRDR